jgi:hypothetical protein
VLLEIHGHHFPGRTWQVEGRPCHNLHVGLQVLRDPTGLVPGDSDTAIWSTEIEIVDLSEGADFRGPAVQGRRGSRFIYLTWGDVRPDGSFAMVRRAKLMLDDLTSPGPLPNRIAESSCWSTSPTSLAVPAARHSTRRRFSWSGQVRRNPVGMTKPRKAHRT